MSSLSVLDLLDGHDHVESSGHVLEIEAPQGQHGMSLALTLRSSTWLWSFLYTISVRTRNRFYQYNRGTRSCGDEIPQLR